MKISRHIFKAYDIRGISGTEITPELAKAMGRAFVTFLRREISDERKLVIAVGRDMRENSEEFQQMVHAGILESGAQVVDIGLVSTPSFYFGVGYTGADGGLMVTASHNPAEYNGFKLTRKNAIPIGGDTGINEIADIIENDDFISVNEKGELKKIEGIPERDVKAQIEFAGEDEIGEWKIVADSANGMGAQYLDLMFKELDFDVERMYWDFDGTFPNHEANPFKDENVADIKAKVLELGADFGIATDGDGDRIFFIDNEGEVVEPAIVRGILARAMLRKNPGATIVYDIRPGKITEDMILEAGGKPVVARVGHSLIKAKMREVDAVYGGESSGHFFYKFPTGTYEGPVTVAVQMMQELKRSGKTMAEFVKPLKRYAHSGEINFEVEDKEGMMKKIKESYADGELNELDGITITFKDFWFNVRPSNTESKLRLNLEAVDEETMIKRRDEISDIIKTG